MLNVVMNKIDHYSLKGIKIYLMDFQIITQHNMIFTFFLLEHFSPHS
jgi:hypothetical protein